MTSADSTSVNKRPPSRRTITVTLSISTVVSSLIVLCAGFICVFSLGIILGRGHNPEAAFPAIEKWMPHPTVKDTPRIVSGAETPNVQSDARKADAGKGAEGSATRQPDTSTTAQGTGSHSRVIDPGELVFRDNLKPPASSSRRTTAQQTQTPKPPQPARVAPATEKNAQSASAGKEIAQSVFNYVYQVAAYKDAGPSDKLAAKLKSAGINARTEKSVDKGTTWFKTVVDFRGTPDATDALRKKLQGQGFDRLILKSKTPAQ